MRQIESVRSARTATIRFVALGLRWLAKDGTTAATVVDIEIHLRGS